MSLPLCFVILASCSSLLLGQADAYRRKGIIGGELPPLSEFTYTVAIQYQKCTGCSGGILDEYHVVTAAHCVINHENQFYGWPLQVVTGTNDLNDEGIETTLRIDVEKVYVPRRFEPALGGEEAIADIAVLKLSRALSFAENPNLGQLELPKHVKHDYAGVTARASGFGISDVKIKHDPESGKQVKCDWVNDNRLRHVKAYVLTNRMCSQMTGVMMSKSYMCVTMGNPFQFEGICEGDSGGPLVYNGILIGVANAGCGAPAAPAVYARVTSYLKFLEKAMKDEVDPEIRVKVLSARDEQHKMTACSS